MKEKIGKIVIFALVSSQILIKSSYGWMITTFSTCSYGQLPFRLPKKMLCIEEKGKEEEESE
jgi:hypothetical protein